MCRAMIRSVGAGEIFALDAHASYRCRHSGACCTAGWTIPVEPRLLPLLSSTWLQPDEQGTCPQYDCASGLCGLHCSGGEAMLPESCHHFPRRALIDSRGTSVALSHFCPTAASLLLVNDRPLAVVSMPEAFPASRAYDGLDARGAWPPLLRPDALFDDESYGCWERYLVGAISTSPVGVHETLLNVAATAEQLRKWHIERGTLVDWTNDVLKQRSAPGEAVRHRYARFSGVEACRRVVGAVPPTLDAPSPPDDLDQIEAQWVVPFWAAHERLALKYVAAKAFASWTAYQSRDIRTQIAELFTTAAVLRVECARTCAAAVAPLDRARLIEAVRRSDLLLMHLVDRDALLPWLRQAEQDDDAR